MHGIRAIVRLRSAGNFLEAVASCLCAHFLVAKDQGGEICPDVLVDTPLQGPGETPCAAPGSRCRFAAIFLPIQAMVESIDHIGKVMGIKTVAEYVFDKNTYLKLKQIGVDFVQGYYVHTPMPTSDLELLDTVETLAQAKKEINPTLI